jgi:hypothetical protein
MKITTRQCSILKFQKLSCLTYCQNFPHVDDNHSTYLTKLEKKKKNPTLVCPCVFGCVCVCVCVCFFFSKMLGPPHHLGVPNIFINKVVCLFVVLRFPNESACGCPLDQPTILKPSMHRGALRWFHNV